MRRMRRGSQCDKVKMGATVGEKNPKGRVRERYLKRFRYDASSITLL